MKRSLWACRDADGTESVFRSNVRPRLYGETWSGLGDGSRIAGGAIAALACQLLNGVECRKIKTLDLEEWKIEYDDPPSLRSVWEEFRRNVMSEDGPESKILKYLEPLAYALEREFPDLASKENQ